MKRLIIFTMLAFSYLVVKAQEADSVKSQGIYLVINGQPATQEEFNLLQQDTTVVIHFIPSKQAISLFSPAARNGALMIASPDMKEGPKGIYLYGDTRISADSIKYDNISRIDVIRGQQAINLYGPAGKDGVFILHDATPRFTDVILRITDKNGKPVRKATIFNENGSILAKSDKCGWVTLENFSQGNTVTISAGKKKLSGLVITGPVMNVKL